MEMHYIFPNIIHLLTCIIIVSVSPWAVGGSNEEINNPPVTEVEKMLQGP